MERSEVRVWRRTGSGSMSHFDPGWGYAACGVGVLRRPGDDAPHCERCEAWKSKRAKENNDE